MGDQGGVALSTQPLVLVADDEPRITKLVSIALQAEGFRVVTADGSRGGHRAARFERRHDPAHISQEK